MSVSRGGFEGRGGHRFKLKVVFQLPVSASFVLLYLISRFAFLFPFSLLIAVATSTERLRLSEGLVFAEEMQTDPEMV